MTTYDPPEKRKEIMVFKPSIVNSSGSVEGVVDDAVGIEIKRVLDSIQKSHACIFSYTFVEGNVKFFFKARNTYRTVLAGIRIFRIPASTHIIEKDFKEVLIEARKKSGELPPDEKEYQRYRNVVREGMLILGPGMSMPAINRLSDPQKYLAQFVVYFEPTLGVWGKIKSLVHIFFTYAAMFLNALAWGGTAKGGIDLVITRYALEHGRIFDVGLYIVFPLVFFLVSLFAQYWFIRRGDYSSARSWGMFFLMVFILYVWTAFGGAI